MPLLQPPPTAAAGSRRPKTPPLSLGSYISAEEEIGWLVDTLLQQKREIRTATCDRRENGANKMVIISGRFFIYS